MASFDEGFQGPPLEQSGDVVLLPLCSRQGCLQTWQSTASQYLGIKGVPLLEREVGERLSLRI